MPTQPSSTLSGAPFAIGVYALVWGAAVAYLYVSGGDAMTSLSLMAVFGVGVATLVWWLTRGAEAPAIPVARPRTESIAVLIYLALYAVLFLGPGMTWARHVVPPGREQELIVIGLKLVVHVVLPALLLTALSAKVAPLFQLGLNGRKFWRSFIALSVALLAIQCLISPSLDQIRSANASISTLLWAAPASFIWIAIEAGFCEEFLYRAVVQTRLSAWFKSPWMGVAISALLFGLAHAPGLYLRGNADVDGWSTNPVQVAAYTVAMLSPLGLVFGLIYTRTKSLLLVVLLHAMVDVLPNLPRFMDIWAS